MSRFLVQIKFLGRKVLYMNQKSARQIVIKSVNGSVGWDGLLPSLLVYGVMRRLFLSFDAPASTTIEKAAVSKVTKSRTQRSSRCQPQETQRAGNELMVAHRENTTRISLAAKFNSRWLFRRSSFAAQALQENMYKTLY